MHPRGKVDPKLQRATEMVWHEKARRRASPLGGGDWTVCQHINRPIEG